MCVGKRERERGSSNLTQIDTVERFINFAPRELTKLDHLL